MLNLCKMACGNLPHSMQLLANISSPYLFSKTDDLPNLNPTFSWTPCPFMTLAHLPTQYISGDAFGSNDRTQSNKPSAEPLVH